MFFATHKEFQVVQGHMTSTAAIYLPVAKKAGVPVKTNGATYTGNMYSVFKKCGFVWDLC